MRETQTVQVCKEFRRNNKCEFGKRCKYAHPGDGVQLVPSDVKICQDFLSTKTCSREICKHYHPFEGQKIRPETSFLKVCREYFDNASCGRDPCNFAHPDEKCAMPLHVQICVNFLIGKCVLERDCKYYHDTEQRLDAIPCTDYPNCARGATCSFSHALMVDSSLMVDSLALPSRGSGNNISEQPPFACFDYLDGRCTRGATCRFSHERGRATTSDAHMSVNKRAPGGRSRSDRGDLVESLLDKRQSADPRRECLDFFHGRCARGEECKFRHPGATGGLKGGDLEASKRNPPPTFADASRECLDFIYGRCARGLECKFKHNEGSTRPAFGGDRGGGILDAPLPETSNIFRPRSETAAEDPAHAAHQCLDYFHGRCNRGDSCKFSHGGEMRDTSDRERERDVAATSVSLPSALDRALDRGLSEADRQRR